MSNREKGISPVPSKKESKESMEEALFRSRSDMIAELVISAHVDPETIESGIYEPLIDTSKLIDLEKLMQQSDPSAPSIKK